MKQVMMGGIGINRTLCKSFDRLPRQYFTT